MEYSQRYKALLNKYMALARSCVSQVRREKVYLDSLIKALLSTSSYKKDLYPEEEVRKNFLNKISYLACNGTFDEIFSFFINDYSKIEIEHAHSHTMINLFSDSIYPEFMIMMLDDLKGIKRGEISNTDEDLREKIKENRANIRQNIKEREELNKQQNELRNRIKALDKEKKNVIRE